MIVQAAEMFQRQKFLVAPGYQIPFAERIKKEANILTGGVGLITDAQQAEKIISEEQADISTACKANAARSVLGFACSKRIKC